MKDLDIKRNIGHTNWTIKLLKLIGKLEDSNEIQFSDSIEKCKLLELVNKLEKGNERELSDSMDKYKYNYTPKQAFNHYRTLLAMDCPQRYEEWLEEYLYNLHNLGYHVNDIQKGINMSLYYYNENLPTEFAADCIYYFKNELILENINLFLNKSLVKKSSAEKYSNNYQSLSEEEQIKLLEYP